MNSPQVEFQTQFDDLHRDILVAQYVRLFRQHVEEVVGQRLGVLPLRGAKQSQGLQVASGRNERLSPREDVTGTYPHDSFSTEQR